MSTMATTGIPRRVGFVHGVLFANRIDYHKRVGQLRHLKYPVEIAPKLLPLRD